MPIILLAMLAFSLVHSLLAGQNVKQWFRRRAGPRAYEGFYLLAYNALATLMILPVVAFVLLRPGAVIWHITNPIAWVVLNGLRAVGVVGLGISLLQIDLGRFTGIPQALAYLRGDLLPLPPKPLQTGGLYQIVRHPLYFFTLLALWPATTMTEAMLAFNIGVTAYIIIGSLFEERRLLNTFGEDYRRYRERVPWMLPRFRRKA